ncbi:MAG: hypothetical protein IJQ08_00075, partial [Synergistaceae bacterium]|nr:hypothetical protein [Synergistaceae bacterium]
MSEHKTTEMLQEEAAKIWAGLEGKTLTNKDRFGIPQQEMPSQEPEVRAHNMSEVALGYTETQARVEAERCIQCPTAPCKKGCPVGVPIPEFIKHIQAGDFKGAIDTIKTTN